MLKDHLVLSLAPFSLYDSSPNLLRAHVLDVDFLLGRGRYPKDAAGIGLFREPAPPEPFYRLRPTLLISDD
jgi:hypothetical protein